MPATRESPDLLIVGASARAAAFSAIRARLRVATADLFADRDLAAVADVTAIADWPHGIERWVAGFPDDVPLIYVGGLENEPELLDRLAEARLVLGVLGEPLRSVRTPESLAEIVRAAGLPFPRIVRPEQSDRDGSESASSEGGWGSSACECPRPWGAQETHDLGHVAPATQSQILRLIHHHRGTQWLVKPTKSAAGRGVRRWQGESLHRGEYLQEFIEGRPGSAAYLACGGRVELLGVTELLLPDEPPLSVDAPFTYVGSITAEIGDAGELERLGRSLTATGLRGLFGVDFVQQEVPESGRLVPIEVNPRYTAGMEVLELRSGRSFVAEHLRAFADVPFAGASGWCGVTTPVRSASEGPSHVFGKLIVYAPRSLRVGALPITAPADLLDPRCPSPVADVPAEGMIVPAGAPICTVFATGSDHTDCLALLKRRKQEVLSRCEPACDDIGPAA